MAIKLIANYSKRLGLPGYSSHQFSISVETELVKTDDVPAETERLYQLLQNNVDEQILVTGFVPPVNYGIEGHSAEIDRISPRDSGPAAWQYGSSWRCSDRQRELILAIVEEHHLEKSEVEAAAVGRFGKGVKHLNKREASGLIDELLGNQGRGRDVHDGPVRSKERSSR